MLLRTKLSLDYLWLLNFTDCTGHTCCRLSNGYKHHGLDCGVTEESIGSGKGCSRLDNLCTRLRVSMDTRHIGFGSVVGKIIISISTCVLIQYLSQKCKSCDICGNAYVCMNVSGVRLHLLSSSKPWGWKQYISLKHCYTHTSLI